MSNFIHHDLDNRRGSEIVEITLKSNAANVRLMDSSNFQRYRNGSQHRYTGGFAKSSPYSFSHSQLGSLARSRGHAGLGRLHAVLRSGVAGEHFPLRWSR